MRRSSRVLLLLCLALCALGTLSWLAASAEDRAGRLEVSFLDVGQGDAIFITAPSGRQVLIDGGPTSRVLREVAGMMPWYDRSIDIMLATHPDADHIAGLVDVLERYRVGLVLRSSVRGETALAGTFDDATEGLDARIVERGDIMDLGGGARLEILFPDRAVPHVATNEGCVVARLVYGETAFMLPCDTTKAVEEYLARLDGTALRSNVLKAAHHGSKTSSAAAFVGSVAPEYAVYSRGCGNSYGHPHPETIATYERFAIPTVDTCEEGSITFVSDGRTVWRK